ncbi:hypothetical protein BH23PLA1_BH23PLA1_32950 [soil metagenome]
MSHTVAVLALILSVEGVASEPPENLKPPVENGPFLVPAPGQASEPVWGLKGGIAVGLWPTPGPRGLFRIYAPYLDQPPRRMINYVAVEPIVEGRRGLSELEPSPRDGKPGKRLWAVETPEAHPGPKDPWDRPAAGKIDEVEPGVHRLTVFFHVERFDHGARPILELTLREDRPFEVRFRVFAHEDSAELESCVLSATMGNYARLRQLWLQDQIIDATKLWDDFEPTRENWGFAPHHRWEQDQMLIRNGEAIVAMTTDEANPVEVEYDEAVPPWWRYEGRPATQYWRSPAEPGLAVQLNGRLTYWATQAPIPGGMSFENFELIAPFQPGQQFTFGVTLEKPEALGFEIPVDPL